MARSTSFHDPQSIWGTGVVTLSWTSTNPEGRERIAVDISFIWCEQAFTLSGNMFGSVVEYRTSGAEWSITIDGESEFSEETRQRMRLHREDGMFWPNYFGFLAGLPS